ncbi:MAG TPA: adenylate/guanylate cyclase domain-containing protein [Vicinamibacteria bacterium]|jgi:adenylate cyclase|nr:adenylate/guanylate cyclase domain-containing protein [Vicinamibacteria bacterium]
MYRLIYQDGDTPQAYTFTEGEVTIGRSPDCQIVLKDFGISRTHARLFADEEGVRIQDLKSKNGTQVNGVPVVEAPLKDGDRILLGKFQLAFSKTLEGKVVLDEAKPLSEEAGTIIRSVGELSKLLSDTGQREAVGLAEKKVSADVLDVEKANRILKVLTKVAETLIAVRPVEEVLQQVMDIVFEHIPADRGFLMLSEDGSDKLIPMVVKHRNSNSADEGKISISKTIADRVTKDRVSILTSDAMVDPRFGAGDSIRFHGIRSAMCAPLWNQASVIGIIHVDSPMLANCFTLNDLDLLTALANYAAVAVERARLNQKIVAEEKKRERLGRFLSPQVTARILATSESQGMALGVPEVKDVSVLFSDIVGFTGMSEKMSPAAVSLLLNDYFSRMTDIIFKYEGTLDKYIGDAIMAVFGAPLDMPDHCVRAIKAALEMRDQLEAFNADRKEGPTIRIRIGINSGKAVAGELGGINKKEYTVLGDTVNTASRLESSVAKPMQVVVGENTYNAAKAQFDFKSLGPATLKGKERTVEVYEVLGPIGMAAGAAPPPSTASREA